MSALPFEFERFKKYESYQFHYPIELNLPKNPLRIATNMASVDSGETYIIELCGDGGFEKSYSIAEVHGIQLKFETFAEAEFEGWPLKVEDMETYNQELVDTVAALEAGIGKKVNAHLFIGFEGRGSFGWHRDEGHVMCYMVSGTKLMETETGAHTLNAGDWLFMPEGIQHCATNITNTTMISFGTGSIRPRIKTEMLWASQPSMIG